MKSYVFHIELVEEADGRWSAGVPALPGCGIWGGTKEEALRHINDAVAAYVRDMHAAGEEVHLDATIQVDDEPVVAITV